MHRLGQGNEVDRRDRVQGRKMTLFGKSYFHKHLYVLRSAERRNMSSTFPPGGIVVTGVCWLVCSFVLSLRTFCDLSKSTSSIFMKFGRDVRLSDVHNKITDTPNRVYT